LIVFGKASREVRVKGRLPMSFLSFISEYPIVGK
jgi:hypothetical protein